MTLSVEGALPLQLLATWVDFFAPDFHSLRMACCAALLATSLMLDNCNSHMLHGRSCTKPAPLNLLSPTFAGECLHWHRALLVESHPQRAPHSRQ